MNPYKMAEKLPKNGLRNITVTMATRFHSVHSVHSGLVTTALDTSIVPYFQKVKLGRPIYSCALKDLLDILAMDESASWARALRVQYFPCINGVWDHGDLHLK